jgi:hypothetical protein
LLRIRYERAFSDEQIVAIVKEGKLAGRWPTCAGRQARQTDRRPFPSHC